MGENFVGPDLEAYARPSCRIRADENLAFPSPVHVMIVAVIKRSCSAVLKRRVPSPLPPPLQS